MSSSILLPGHVHWISLETAQVMTARYRAKKENILAPEYKDQDILSICETFNRSEFDYVLAQPDCVGLRVYFGMEPDLKVKVIVVGVDKDNKDILPSSLPNEESLTEPPPTGIVEIGRPCPDFCPTPPL